jgi:OHCU decarboxylase
MVQYAAGKLRERRLVSIWNLPELRRIEVLPSEIQIGSGCTYTDLRNNEIVAREFTLLASAASWTGGIANQNRGTLGGNIVNASPAADSLPALLVYDAELILVSARGERRIAYSNFHLDYRKTQIQRDELIRTVCLPRRFSGYFAHSRKVGARRAQAIAKVCLAALGRVENGVIADVRLAMGSVAPIPLRLTETERAIKGKRIDPELKQIASKTASKEIRPIDDIRSTARYRAAVAGNLVAEFLERLRAMETKASDVLARWNSMPAHEAVEEILPCCGSQAWARRMAAHRPVRDEASLLAASDEVWNNLPEADWLEAFATHPRIGELHVPPSASVRSATWSSAEQQRVGAANDQVKAALVEGNRKYEKRFGRIFIVCATGKSAPEILEILQRRLRNDERAEFHEAAEQQRQITQLRLEKLLRS